MKVVLLSILLALAWAAPKDHKLTADLPGCGHWDFDAYSGYIPVDDHNQFHYFFVESQNKPDTDPLVIWFNGGPGCSSMLGFFMEHGVCVWDGIDNNELPHPNEFSWNKQANVLYIESPAGVGFNLGYQGEHLDDEIAGDQEMAFLVNWFKEFPEFKNNKLYITGESYGGIYVPYLAYRLHSNGLTTKSGGDIQLEGIAVGNGVTDWSVDCDPAYIELSYYHGLIPKTLQERIEKTQCDFRTVGGKPLDKECTQIYAEWSKYTRNINVYDVYKSPEDGGLMSNDISVENYLKGEFNHGYTPFLKSTRNIQPFTSHVTSYLDRSDVRAILHVSEKKGKFPPCVNFDYEMLEKATFWIYPILKESGYRILKYSGDTDGSVPTLGTEKWIEKLNWKIKTQHQPLIMHDRVVGYLEERDGLDFFIFHGVGHLVPLWAREESQFVLYKFFNEERIVN